MKRHLTRLPAMAVAVCTLALLAACGSDDESGGGSAAPPEATRQEAQGRDGDRHRGLNDRSFNALAPFVDQADEVRSQIAAGEITDIPSEVKEK